MGVDIKPYRRPVIRQRLISLPQVSDGDADDVYMKSLAEREADRALRALNYPDGYNPAPPDDEGEGGGEEPPPSDTTAPTITTAATYDQVENADWSIGLAADEIVTWSKNGGADASLFDLSGSTLSLTSRDYEIPTDGNDDNVYEVIVRATDAAGNTTDKTISVTITDIDDTAPSITTGASQSVNEHTAFSIGLTADEVVTWSIVGGADAAHFSLVGSTLSMSAKDYEVPDDADNNRTYIVTVRATDGAGNTTDKTLTITVNDIDDSAPVISTNSAQSIEENQAFSITLAANETVTWSKIGGADQALFTLSGSTLSMAAKDYETPEDADTDNQYIVTVRATDTNGNYTDKTITVTVTDASEIVVGENDELFVRFNSLSAVDAYGKHTVAVVGASLTTGPNGNAVALAGNTGSYIDYGVATEWAFLHLSAGDYTVEMIVKAVTDPHYSIFGNTTATGQVGACMSYRGTNQWTWDIENGTGTRAARVDCPTNTGNEANWVHLAVVKQGTTIKFYINGTLQRTVTGGTFSTGDGTGQKRYRSGSHSDGTWFAAMEIDSIRIKKEAVYTANFTAPTSLAA